MDAPAPLVRVMPANWPLDASALALILQFCGVAAIGRSFIFLGLLNQLQELPALFVLTTAYDA
jgi:hypothetical protein